jgi:hypothetical protein
MSMNGLQIGVVIAGITISLFNAIAAFRRDEGKWEGAGYGWAAAACWAGAYFTKLV